MSEQRAVPIESDRQSREHTGRGWALRPDSRDGIRGSCKAISLMPYMVRLAAEEELCLHSFISIFIFSFGISKR